MSDDETDELAAARDHFHYALGPVLLAREVANALDEATRGRDFRVNSAPAWLTLKAMDGHALIVAREACKRFWLSLRDPSKAERLAALCEAACPSEGPRGRRAHAAAELLAARKRLFPLASKAVSKEDVVLLAERLDPETALKDERDDFTHDGMFCRNKGNVSELWIHLAHDRMQRIEQTVVDLALLSKNTITSYEGPSAWWDAKFIVTPLVDAVLLGIHITQTPQREERYTRLHTAFDNQRPKSECFNDAAFLLGVNR